MYAEDMVIYLSKPQQTIEVFMNIIVNACQSIQTKQENNKTLAGKVTIYTLQKNNQLILIFEDNGSGMSEITLQRIFEPFYTTKDVGAGTGLGMAISFGIIEEHGGAIKVNSKLDEGANITISLPL